MTSTKHMRKLSAGANVEHKVVWDRRAVVDQLHPNKETALALMQAVALTPAAALRPFRVLSSGEQARAERWRAAWAW